MSYFAISVKGTEHPSSCVRLPTANVLHYIVVIVVGVVSEVASHCPKLLQPQLGRRRRRRFARAVVDYGGGGGGRLGGCRQACHIQKLEAVRQAQAQFGRALKIAGAATKSGKCRGISTEMDWKLSLWAAVCPFVHLH